MFARALVVWFVLLVVAIVNGAARVAWIIPRVGEQQGHVLSTISLSAAILLVTWLAIAWLDPRTWADAGRIGALWLSLTIAFEFLGGHFLFGRPWKTLLADYNILRGRIWVLVLFATGLAPLAASWAAGVFSRAR